MILLPTKKGKNKKKVSSLGSLQDYKPGFTHSLLPSIIVEKILRQLINKTVLLDVEEIILWSYIISFIPWMTEQINMSPSGTFPQYYDEIKTIQS